VRLGAPLKQRRQFQFLDGADVEQLLKAQPPLVVFQPLGQNRLRCARSKGQAAHGTALRAVGTHGCTYRRRPRLLYEWHGGNDPPALFRPPDLVIGCLFGLIAPTDVPDRATGVAHPAELDTPELGHGCASFASALRQEQAFAMNRTAGDRTQPPQQTLVRRGAA
jgi:hypothetical protein